MLRCRSVFLIGKTFQWLTGMDNIPDPLFADFPDISANIENCPVVDLKNTFPAFTDTFHFLRVHPFVSPLEKLKSILHTQCLEVLFIGSAILFISRQINAVENMIPFAFVEIDHLIFGNFQNIDHRTINGFKAVIRADGAPDGSIHIVGFGNSLGSFSCKPVIAFQIMFSHITKMQADISSLIDDSTITLQLGEGLVVLTGI